MGWLLAAGLLLPAGAPRAQGPANLDFEQPSLADSTKPAGWLAGGRGYEVVLDTAVCHSGHASLRSTRKQEGDFCVGTSSFPMRLAAGKTIRYRGYIKTEGVASGFAGLWWRVDGKGGILGFDNMQDRGVKGATDWACYEIQMKVDPAGTNINFGVLHSGDGTAWFDGLEIEVDGVPYREDAAPATAKEIAWLRKHAIPLKTAQAGHGFRDLAPLKRLIGDARLVALGEATHGTSEFFKMKHRLTEFLAGEMGFTVFAIEANMPEARRVNDYVLTGKGDPKAALAGMYFWTWNTQEVLDFVEWMRAYNASGRGRMEFWGFDLQTPDVAMDSVEAFVARADSGFAVAVAGAYEKVRAVVKEQRSGHRSAVAAETWREEAEKVRRHLEAGRAGYLARFSQDEVEWAIQDARIVEQGALASIAGPGGFAGRDSCMAANVDWILSRRPEGTKIVLWAHNGHVRRRVGWMGNYLAARHGSALRVFAFAFNEGSYMAIGSRGLSSYPAIPAPAGSVEQACHATGLPHFVLDLRGAAGAPESAWLTRSPPMRSIGAVAVDFGFNPTDVTADFDALIYSDRSTPSASLGRPGGPR